MPSAEEYCKAKSKELNPKKPKGIRPKKQVMALFYEDDQEMMEIYYALCRKYPTTKKNGDPRKGKFNMAEFLKDFKDKILAD